jgi:hypothetical protein
MQTRKTIILFNVNKKVSISTILNNIPHKQIKSYYGAFFQLGLYLITLS